MTPDDEGAGSYADGGMTAIGPVTPTMLAHLRATKPWVRLMSIVGFAVSALLLVFALIVPFVAVLSRELGGAIGGIGIAVVYLLLGCLYFFPSLFLFRYASAIRDLLITGDGASLESALSHQKSFWRMVGIATIVMLCIYAVVLIVLLLAAILAASS